MKRLAIFLLALALTLGLSAVSFAGPSVSLSDSPTLQSSGTPTQPPGKKKMKKQKAPKVKKSKRNKKNKKSKKSKK